MERDEIRLLRDFAGDVPGVDRDTKTDAYLYATGHVSSKLIRRRLPRPSKRVKYYAGAIALACTAALIAAVSLTGAPAYQTGPDSLGIGFTPTVDRPLPGGAIQVSLTQAADVLGAPLTLPDSSSPSAKSGRQSAADVGAVWSSRASNSPVGETVAVTFPSEGFYVRYTRPVPYKDALANYESYVQASPGAQVVYLHGVPALTDESPPGPDGSTWGAVEFVSHGTLIAVTGTADVSTLQSAAQSILDQAGS